MSWATCRRRHRVYAPTSNIASHDNHKKINLWVSFSLPCGYGASLGGPSAEFCYDINRKRAGFYQTRVNLTEIESFCELSVWTKSAKCLFMLVPPTHKVSCRVPGCILISSKTLFENRNNHSLHATRCKMADSHLNLIGADLNQLKGALSRYLAT